VEFRLQGREAIVDFLLSPGRAMTSRWEGVSLLGIDPATNRPYWDGKQAVLTDRVVILGSFERFFVALAAIGIWGIFITDLLNWVSTFATPEGPPPIHRSIGQ
jgi:hypothetical protein